MFKNAFQSGFLSVLYSIGSKPLEIWDKQGAACAQAARRAAHMYTQQMNVHRWKCDELCSPHSLLPQLAMVTSSASQTQTSSPLSWRLWGRTCLQRISPAQQIPTKHWALSCPSWFSLSRTSTNTSGKLRLEPLVQHLVYITYMVLPLCSFEVQVLDDKNVRRRFRASNYQVRSMGSANWLL